MKRLAGTTDAPRAAGIGAEMDFGKLKGYIFDLDGTLFASTGIWRGIYADTLAHFGKEMPDDYVTAVTHLDIARGTAYTAERFGLDQREVERLWREKAAKAYGEVVSLTPHATELLSAIRACGGRLAVATALDEDLSKMCLTRHGAEGFFQVIATVKDAGRDKRFPDVYLAAAKGLGLAPSDCAVVEDGLTGARTAKRAGFFVAGVRDAASGSSAEDMLSVCDTFADDFGDYLPLFSAGGKGC